MIKLLKTALISSVAAVTLFSCSNSSKTKCIACGLEAKTTVFEFPEEIPADLLNGEKQSELSAEDFNEIYEGILADIYSSLDSESLVKKDGKISNKQPLCENKKRCDDKCLETAENSVTTCFRCEKLIFKTNKNTSVQMCNDCSAYLEEYLDKLMVLIPAANDSDGALNDFYVSKYETTQEFYKLIMGENPSYRSGKNKPVECVTDQNIMDFCSRLSAITGKNYRLLSNDEYNFITKDIRYTKEQLNNLSWNIDNSGETTHEVGKTKNSTKYKLYDLIGNVWESVMSPDGSEIRRRGGGYNNYVFKLQPNYEATGSESIQLADRGFRIACDAE